MRRQTPAWLGAALAIFVISLALPAPLGAATTARNTRTTRRAPTPPPPTVAPQNIRAAADHAHIVLEWRPVPGASGYRVFRGVAGVWDPSPVGTVERTRYRNSHLTFGTEYSYRVAAVNRGGMGPLSGVASAVPLAPPAGVTAVAGEGQVRLSWQASTGATRYTVYRSTWQRHAFAPVAIDVGAALTFVDMGLANGKKYIYRVRARADGSTSAPSAWVLATPAAPASPPPATAPANLAATLNNGQVTLTWDSVQTATSYRVFRSTTTTFDAAPIATVTTPTFSQPGPAGGVTFSYRVAAHNAGGDGPFSAVVSVTPQPPPAAPGGVSAAPGNGQITVSWTPVPGATAYNVYRGPVAGGQLPAPVGTAIVAPPFVNAGLTNGTTFFYKVTAIGAGGESARSAEVSATPQAPPPSADPTIVSAFRLLRQSTWGPKPGDVDRIVSGGVDAFLAEQFAAPPSVYPDALFAQSVETSQEHFMSLAMTGQDQLRQRVAWALHKIWVVSAVEVNNSRAIVTYYRLMMRGAFGNYRDLMKAVTLNPAMGRYLNFVNNKAQRPTTTPPNIPANENYPRELMQLFTLGLTVLNPDGTPVTGQVPTYTEDDVKALARIMTGWTYGDGDPATVPGNTMGENFGVPMEPVVATRGYHDTTAKTFLGEDFPAGVAAEAELDHALDVIFSHSNVGPFVSRQLIQQLVTSNPSPGYVADVAAVFNGSAGGRGDLGAVVRAILTHPEAAMTTPTSGKLAEPVLFVLSQLRALNATITDHPFMSDKVAEMGQSVFFPPSVFSYFSPGYRVRNTGTPPLGGPEFQGLTSVTALVRANFVGSLIGGRFGTNVTVDYAPFTSRAANAADLVDYVGLAFTGGRLSPAQRAEIIGAVGASGTNAQERVRTAIYLTLVPGVSQVDR